MVSIAAAAAEWTEDLDTHWGVTDYPFYEKSSMPAIEAGTGTGIGPVLLVAVVFYVAAVVCILCIFLGG